MLHLLAFGRFLSHAPHAIHTQSEYGFRLWTSFSVIQIPHLLASKATKYEQCFMLDNGQLYNARYRRMLYRKRIRKEKKRKKTSKPFVLFFQETPKHHAGSLMLAASCPMLYCSRSEAAQGRHSKKKKKKKKTKIKKKGKQKKKA